MKKKNKARKGLEALRVKHNLTQLGMAKRLGVSCRTYGNIENATSDGSLKFWLAVTKEFPEISLEEASSITEVCK